MQRLLLIVLAIAVPLAGCGGDDGHGAGTDAAVIDSAPVIDAGVDAALVVDAAPDASPDAAIDAPPAAPVVSIQITPPSFTIAQGQTRQLTATGTRSDATTTDVTNLVTWTAGAGTSTVIMVSAAGLVTATGEGADTVHASLAGTPGDLITVTVTAATLASIAIAPAGATVGVGQARQYRATGMFTNGTSLDLTQQVVWSSLDPMVATVGNSTGTRGLVTGRAVGTTMITASSMVMGSTMITVGGTPPLVTAITPADAATGVDPRAPITVRFSRAMMPASLTVQTVGGPCTGTIQLSRDHFASCVPVAGPPVMSDGDRLATLTPRPALALGVGYRVRVLGTVLPAVGAATNADVIQLGWRTERPAYACADGLTVSQVYGGGGSVGAPYRHDFVELHNAGPAPVALGGLALYLASPLGTIWTRQPLPFATIPPGGFYLIQEDSAGAVGAPLPAPDFVPASPFALGATAGKVAIAPSATAVDEPCAGALAISNVAYGAADCAEGLPVPALTNTTAAQRVLGGCSDRYDNERDFAEVAPAPRNLAALAGVCSCAVNESEGFAVPAEIAFCAIDTPMITVAAGASTPTIVGRIADPDQTDAPVGNPLIRYQIGYGPVAVNPQVEPGFHWTTATFDEQEPWFLAVFAYRYQASFVAPAAGSYALASRVSLDGVNWTYCDADGAGDAFDTQSFQPFEFDPQRLRALTVTP